ncbi:hypothetical protein HDK77DRAFT_484765 [Phyllosticta capitalensis]
MEDNPPHRDDPNHPPDRDDVPAPARVFENAARLECANMLLRSFLVPLVSPGSFRFRSQAFDSVTGQLGNDFEPLPKFKGQQDDAVLNMAITDLTQMLRDRGIVSFNEPRVQYVRDFATGYREGIDDAKRMQSNASKQAHRNAKAAFHHEFETYQIKETERRQQIKTDYAYQVAELKGEIESLKNGIDTKISDLHVALLAAINTNPSTTPAAAATESFSSVTPIIDLAENHCTREHSMTTRSSDLHVGRSSTTKKRKEPAEGHVERSTTTFRPQFRYLTSPPRQPSPRPALRTLPRRQEHEEGPVARRLFRAIRPAEAFVDDRGDPYPNINTTQGNTFSNRIARNMYVNVAAIRHFLPMTENATVARIYNRYIASLPANTARGGGWYWAPIKGALLIIESIEAEMARHEARHGNVVPFAGFLELDEMWSFLKHEHRDTLHERLQM